MLPEVFTVVVTGQGQIFVRLRVQLPDNVGKLQPSEMWSLVVELVQLNGELLPLQLFHDVPFNFVVGGGANDPRLQNLFQRLAEVGVIVRFGYHSHLVNGKLGIDLETRATEEVC